MTKRNLIYKLKEYCIYSNIFIYICLFVLDCIAAALHFAKLKHCLLQFKMYSDFCIIASHSWLSCLFVCVSVRTDYNSSTNLFANKIVPGWVFLSITSRLTLSLPFHQWPILLFIYLPSVLYNCYSWQHCWIRQLRVTSVITVILVCLRYYMTALYFMRKCKSSFSYFLSLCTFTKLEKVTITFVMSVCLSVCLSILLSSWNKWAPTRWIFLKFNIWVLIETLLGKFKID